MIGCKQQSTINHSMSFVVERCPLCDSECVNRIPQAVTSKEDSKTGKLVKDFIQQNKEVNNEEKQKLSNKVYK